MQNNQFSDGLRRILRDHPALPASTTRELAGAFQAAQAVVCGYLAELTYPLERMSLELRAGSLPYFREGSDQDHKHQSGKKASYRFAGFAPSHMADFEGRLAICRAGGLAREDFVAWQKAFLQKFTFEVIEQVALRVSPVPDISVGEGSANRFRWSLCDALDEARKLRDTILNGNLLLSAKVAIGRGRFHPSFLLDDLFTAGTDGLLIAVNRYDPGVGQFSTYAIPWITMAMDRHVAKTRHLIRIPIGVQEKARRRRNEDDAMGRESESPIPQVQSLEEPLPGCADGDLRLEDLVADPMALRPAVAVELADIAQMLDEGVRKLDRLKQFVIAIRNDVGDAAALAAILFREESALSQARGRASAAAAFALYDDPARIRLLTGLTEEAPSEAMEESEHQFAVAV